MNTITEKLIENFKRYWPFIAEDAVAYSELGTQELKVVTRDGRQYIFDDFEKVLRRIKTNSSDAFMTPENDWKIEFAIRLRKLIETSGLSQRKISKETGLTQCMLSRYTSGKSMPNAYAVYLLAKAIGVSIDRLYDLPK